VIVFVWLFNWRVVSCEWWLCVRCKVLRWLLLWSCARFFYDGGCW